MATELIPLFPLSLVLLPAMPLPLHIFEDRYKQMMRDVISSESDFGVVLAKDEGTLNIGCTAVVRRVMRRYEDGRLDLLAIGQRRFRIHELNDDKPYLQAEVEFFEDTDLSEVSADLKQRATKAYRQLLKLEGVAEGEAEERQKADLGRLSFQIGHLLDDTEKRQTVLALRSEVLRLEFLVKAVPQYLSEQERITLAKRVAPLNGHAKAAGVPNDEH
jgi:Lon protease-like protein